MGEDRDMTMTLAVSDGASVMQVLAVDGEDCLNQAYRFEIDAVSTDQALDCDAWLQRSAFLTLGTTIASPVGVHGQIANIQRLHRGRRMSLYRVSLRPTLQRLAASTAQRCFNGMTVPQIISSLLQAHGLTNTTSGLDRLIGLYPPREHCVQLHETDLHLLQRLCEEEGISFRFEHHQDRHQLVFCDDPAGFAEWPRAIEVDDMRQRLTLQTCYPSHAGERYVPPLTLARADPHDADNQAFFSAPPSDQPPSHAWQLIARQLQRLRCERLQMTARGSGLCLHGGQIVRIKGRPQAQLNDQWLIKEVRHRATAPLPLAEADPEDIARIRALLGQVPPSHDHACGQVTEAVRYTCEFTVIHWAMPFRPSVLHHKPRVEGTLLATLTAEAADRAGRSPIRYDWQGSQGADSWARMPSSLPGYRRGTRVKVTFLDGDADQPLICGMAKDLPSAPGFAARVDGIAQPRDAALIQLEDNQHLRIDSLESLQLQGAKGTLSLAERGIEFSPRQEPPRPGAVAERQIPDSVTTRNDLRLTHPDHPRQPMPHCVWYIVRMDSAELAQLPRIAAEDILLEGKTDAGGWLGLNRYSLARLLQLSRDRPHQLCVVHPGHCRPLRECLATDHRRPPTLA